MSNNQEIDLVITQSRRWENTDYPSNAVRSLDNFLRQPHIATSIKKVIFSAVNEIARSFEPDPDLLTTKLDRKLVEDAVRGICADDTRKKEKLAKFQSRWVNGVMAWKPPAVNGLLLALLENLEYLHIECSMEAFGMPVWNPGAEKHRVDYIRYALEARKDCHTLKTLRVQPLHHPDYCESFTKNLCRLLSAVPGLKTFELTDIDWDWDVGFIVKLESLLATLRSSQAELTFLEIGCWQPGVLVEKRSLAQLTKLEGLDTHSPVLVQYPRDIVSAEKKISLKGIFPPGLKSLAVTNHAHESLAVTNHAHEYEWSDLSEGEGPQDSEEVEAIAMHHDAQMFEALTEIIELGGDGGEPLLKDVSVVTQEFTKDVTDNEDVHVSVWDQYWNEKQKGMGYEERPLMSDDLKMAVVRVRKAAKEFVKACEVRGVEQSFLA